LFADNEEVDVGDIVDSEVVADAVVVAVALVLFVDEDAVILIFVTFVGCVHIRTKNRVWDHVQRTLAFSFVLPPLESSESESLRLLPPVTGILDSMNMLLSK
jgi:hypothetical protein